MSKVIRAPWAGATQHLLFWLFFLLPAYGWSGTGRIEGRIYDPADHPLPGVLMTLTSSPETAPDLTVTDSTGNFGFENLLSGTYTLTASLAAYQEQTLSPVRVEDGETVVLRLVLQLLPYSENVVVQEETGSTEVNEPQQRRQFDARTLDVMALPNDRFVEALPVLPGVVRGPNGRLNFNGARASQSTFIFFLRYTNVFNVFTVF